MSKFTRPKVLLLGKDGMLGSSIFSRLKLESNISLFATSRRSSAPCFFDARHSSLEIILDKIKPDYIINCIGFIHPRLNLESALNALYINSIFSKRLSRVSSDRGIFLIQIGTNAVFFGRSGHYFETSTRIPKTFYGLTKMLGESPTQKSLLIRCSIIGKEKVSAPSKSLFNWFSNLPVESKIQGYSNQIWNGVTTQAFADLCKGIIKNSYCIGGVHHFIPADSVSKNTLLNYFRELLNRNDINICPDAKKKKKNLTLSTANQKRNEYFWSLAGFDYVPNIKELVLTTLV